MADMIVPMPRASGFPACESGTAPGPAAETVRLAYHVSPERVEIRVADEGAGFDPASVPDPTADENLMRPCGRGIMLMRSYMDEVTFSPVGNEVHMVKCRTGCGARR